MRVIAVDDITAMDQPERQTAPRLPPRPPEPDLDECCGSGCEPCVFDLYDQRLERWRARCAAIRAAHGLPPEDEPPC